MAVKKVPKQRPGGALDDRLLHREIDIGKRVAESGNNMLLPVIDAADDGKSLLLVMARAEGALADTVTPKQEPEIVAIMKDIAAGLQQLHSIGIIHRDLKPGNVLRHDGHWKLADFGIARDEEIGTQYPTFRGGGSPAYMAPEIWEGKSPTVKTDLYALGCTAFELLTGKPPYTGDTAAIQAGHLTQAIPDIPARNTTLKNLIIRLMAKNPGERPQDARAVLERLARAVQWLSPAQEAIAQSLGKHSSEKSREAAAEAAAKARIQEYKQQAAQALADLREIVRDTLEELQNIEPEVKTGRPAKNAISLVLHDISVTLAVWHDTTTTNELAPDLRQ
jgi:serine/threonine protein kinase